MVWGRSNSSDLWRLKLNCALGRLGMLLSRTACRLRQRSIMFWQSQAQQLSELEIDLGYYRQSIVISYFPPTGYFGIRKDVNSRGLAQDSIVVLELVLPTSRKLYRWNRSGMVEAITSGRLRQRSSYSYPGLGTDFPASSRRHESGDRSQTAKLANLT
jgi:hypothetical protein